MGATARATGSRINSESIVIVIAKHSSATTFRVGGGGNLMHLHLHLQAARDLRFQL